MVVMWCSTLLLNNILINTTITWSTRMIGWGGRYLRMEIEMWCFMRRARWQGNEHSEYDGDERGFQFKFIHLIKSFLHDIHTKHVWYCVVRGNDNSKTHCIFVSVWMKLWNSHFHQQYIWSGMCDYQTTHWFVHVGCWSWLFWQWVWKRYFIHIMIYHKYMCVDDLMRENCNVCDCGCFRLRIWKRLRWNWNKSVEMNKWEEVYYESFRNGLFEFVRCIWMRRLNVFCVFFFLFVCLFCQLKMKRMNEGYWRVIVEWMKVISSQRLWEEVVLIQPFIKWFEINTVGMCERWYWIKFISWWKGSDICLWGMWNRTSINSFNDKWCLVVLHEVEVIVLDWKKDDLLNDECVVSSKQG